MIQKASGVKRLRFLRLTAEKQGSLLDAPGVVMQQEEVTVDQDIPAVMEEATEVDSDLPSLPIE